MPSLTLEELRLLAQRTQRPSLSIFLPTHRAGQNTDQDPIRFKNLLQEAERRLSDEGMKPRELGKLFQPAWALLDDSFFWRHLYEGLAVYLAPDDFHTYRLPFRIEEQLVIARSYYVKPVLPLFTNNGHYYVLALSLNEVRLFEGTRDSVGQIDLPDGTPRSLDEALQFDDPEKQLQFRTPTPAGAMFHGHGPGDEDRKERIERYLNRLDASLRPVFREQPAPLVLAGVDYLLPIYRQVSEYAHIVPDGILGNPETLRPEELHARAWPLVEPHFRREMGEVLGAYQQLSNTEKATDQLEAIVAGAFHGRVDKLVLAADSQVWGTFEAETGRVTHFQAGQSREDDLPLLDFAAMETLAKGGTVYAITQSEMPVSASALAIFRY
jgi:hypothetical protein